MNVRMSYGKRLAAALLAGVAVVAGLTVGGQQVAAFRGGFGGFHGGGGFGGFHGGGGGFGGFHGGGFGGFHSGGFAGGSSRFGDGGFFDRSSDGGFGRGGWGSVHSAGTFSDRADTFQQSHGEFSSDAGARQQNRFNEANTLQSNRYNAANSLQSNRYNDARNVQINRQNDFNSYSGSWGGYYSGLGFGAGLAIGASVAALPAAAVALSVAGTPYWLFKWHLLCVARRPVCRYRSPHRCGGPNHSAVVLDPLCGFGDRVRLQRCIL